MLRNLLPYFPCHSNTALAHSSPHAFSLQVEHSYDAEDLMPHVLPADNAVLLPLKHLCPCLTVQVERSYDAEDLLPASERRSRAAVIAYVARYYSGLPFQVSVVIQVPVVHRRRKAFWWPVHLAAAWPFQVRFVDGSRKACWWSLRYYSGLPFQVCVVV